MHRSADVKQRAEPRTARRCACAQGHAQKCRRRAAGRATHRSMLCMRTRRMHNSADVEGRAEPRTA
eukprot:952175-Pleurochrysis_carterae.AAC.1